MAVNCWWNKALHLGHNVSVLCHVSTPGRANSCGLCQLYVIKPDHRYQFPSTCASTKETFNFSIAAEHREHIHCICNRNTAETCNVTVRGDCEYDRIDHLSLMASLLALGMFRSQRSQKGVVYKKHCVMTYSIWVFINRSFPPRSKLNSTHTMNGRITIRGLTKIQYAYFVSAQVWVVTDYI